MIASPRSSKAIVSLVFVATIIAWLSAPTVAQVLGLLDNLSDPPPALGTAASVGAIRPWDGGAVGAHDRPLERTLTAVARGAAGNSAASAAAILETGSLLLAPQDTFLNINATNYSTEPTLATYTWPDYQVANAIVMKFDFSSLPVGVIVQGATLNLALVQSDTALDSTYTVTAHKLLGKNPDIATATGSTANGITGWTPNACCYNGVPLAQADISPAYHTAAIDKVPGLKAWDVTTMVQEWLLNPSTNFGLLLNSDASKPRDRYRIFASMEHPDSNLHPFLKVTFAAADVTPPSVVITTPPAGDVSGTVPLAASATDNVAVAGVQFQLNGIPVGPELTAYPYVLNWDTATVSDGSYTLTAVARDWAGNAATSPAVSVTVKNGILLLSPQDTYLNLNATNYNSDTILATYTWPDYKVANAILMKFDLSALPPGAVVQEARVFLALVQSDATATNTYTVTANKMLGKNPVIAQATGYTADGVTTWTPSACCYNGVPLAQSDLSLAYDTQAIDKTPGFKSWTMTTMLQEWLVDPLTNFGVLLNSDASKPRDQYRYFASMEHSDPSLRPFLRVTYLAPAPDTTPPTVAITDPTGGTTASATVTVSAGASDNVGVVGVQFKLDGANLGVEVATAPYSVSWNTTTAANGSRTLTAVARDAAGNLTTSAAVAVTVANDTTPPTVSITAPIGGASVSGTVIVTAGASDNIGVVGVQFRLDGANLGAEVATAPYSVSWNTTSAANGSHTLTAVARDAAGNTATATAVTVTVANDTTPPTVSVTSPTAGATVSGTITVSANASDNVGVVGIQFNLDGATLGAEDPTAPYSVSWNTATAANGSHTLTAVARDAAGNVVTSTAVVVTVLNDTTPPVISAVAAASITASGTTISWTTNEASDSQVEYGLTASYGSATTLNPTMVASHRAPVSGLAANALYHFRVRSRDAAGNLATSGDFTFITLVPPDVTPPSVSMTAPPAGTVSGTTTVSATASDNVAVVGVQFKLDGANLGAEDTTAPYSISWDTTQAANGSHTLTAVARDAAGNQTTSAAVSVTVSNGSSGGLIFESNWATATGTSSTAVTDGGRWPIYHQFDNPPTPGMTVVTGGPDAQNALRVQQRGDLYPVEIATTNFIAQGSDYYLRYYFKTDDTSSAGDHIVTVGPGIAVPPGDNLTFLRKSGGTADWRMVLSAYGCGDPIGYPLQHWGPDPRLLNGQWYRFEYNVHFTDATHMQVHPRVYSATGALLYDDDDFRQESWGTSSFLWNGRNDWTLASFYAAGHSFCVDPVVMNDFGLGNNGQAGAANTGLYWYFAAVQIRSDSWPGPVGGSVADTTLPSTPSGLTATAASSSQINLSWTAATDNVGVTGYKISRCTGSSTCTPTLLTTLGQVTSYSNTGLSASTVYRYEVSALDAASNESGKSAIASATTPAPPAPAGDIAARYPGDVGIENDTNVVFIERFDEGTLTNLFSRWTDILNGSAMSFSSDVPVGSPVAQSLNIPWIGGVSNGGHLYKLLSPGVDDTLYVRYYIKYPTSGRYRHDGIWMGGHNPPITWPDPQAGFKPTGSDRLSASAEQSDDLTHFDHYDYWMNMRQAADGKYWGSTLLNNPNVKATPGQWMCVEHMVKLNNPVTAFNGEHAIWVDGVKVSHLGQGFPNGYWSGGNFTQDPSGTPFEGFRWRSDTSLNLNWIWLQNYSPDDPAGFTSSIKYAHVVAAKSYIGCLASGSGSSDTTPPTVSLTSPAAGATVSGAITVAASASDNVGIAGVQFKLDGANLGAEDTTSPYLISWDTTAAANGTHTLTAVARDAAGNQAASASVSVSANNASSGGGAVFASNWDTATGTSTTAVTDAGRWPNYWEFNNGSNVQLLSVVPGGVNGHNALRVQQRGSTYAANLQIDNVLPQSNDYYLRYYMKNDDTSGQGDHLVTADTWQYWNLTYMRKYGGPVSWKFVTSLYGCGYTYPIGHWGPALPLLNGQWYRFEYYVHYVDATHVQVHPRVYDATGLLILSDAQFLQSDFGGGDVERPQRLDTRVLLRGRLQLLRRSHLDERLRAGQQRPAGSQRYRPILVLLSRRNPHRQVAGCGSMTCSATWRFGPCGTGWPVRGRDRLRRLARRWRRDRSDWTPADDDVIPAL